MNNTRGWALSIIIYEFHLRKNLSSLDNFTRRVAPAYTRSPFFFDSSLHCVYTPPLIHFLSILFQCSRCCCCFSLFCPSINPRTTTPIRSFTIIINAALNTPRVNSGPIPWYNPHTPPELNCSAIICGIVGFTLASPYVLCNMTLARKYGYVNIVATIRANIPKKNASAALNDSSTNCLDCELTRRAANTIFFTCSYTVYWIAGLRHRTVYAWIPL